MTVPTGNSSAVGAQLPAPSASVIVQTVVAPAESVTVPVGVSSAPDTVTVNCSACSSPYTMSGADRVSAVADVASLPGVAADATPDPAEQNPAISATAANAETQRFNATPSHECGNIFAKHPGVFREMQTAMPMTPAASPHRYFAMLRMRGM
jgi:hypothetical protein